MWRRTHGTCCGRAVCLEETGLLHDPEELLLADLAVPVPVCLINHLLNLLVCEVLAQLFGHTLQILEGDEAWSTGTWAVGTEGRTAATQVCPRFMALLPRHEGCQGLATAGCGKEGCRLQTAFITQLQTASIAPLPCRETTRAIPAAQ